MVKNVPTNVITGALGVGKTTLIQSLLSNKPVGERWAVLVNEFGEVGIDGSMLSSGTVDGKEKSIFIKEVPGGCMCCTSGLPMQIALNLLLAQAKPHRLLIEPTGLGHPKEVLETLSQSHYKDVLNVQATLTLIDVRKLDDQKWRNHETFQAQMQIADTVVVTKSDLYTHDCMPTLETYMHEIGVSSTPVVHANCGKVDNRLLANASNFTLHLSDSEQHHHTNKLNSANTLIAPKEGALRIANQGEGYFSRGWLCAATYAFSYKQCVMLFKTYTAERLKAVIITDSGIFAFNVADGAFEERRLDEAEDSRIELISSSEDFANTFAEAIDSLIDEYTK